jgi:hypothetical protein
MAATRQRRQLALRRILLDAHGRLTADAKVIVCDLRNFCYAAKPTITFSPVSGTIDAHASIAAAARREVWDRLARLLAIDEKQILNAEDRDL